MYSFFGVKYGKSIHTWMAALCVAFIIGALIFQGQALASNGDNGGEFLYIAVAGPLSGPGKHRGQEAVNVVNMRLEEINALGGINGKMVKALVFDDRNEIEKAISVAREIAENDQILMVIGHRRSDSCIAAGPIYKEHRIPAITPTATAEAVTRGNDWYFRVIFDNEQQGRMLATYVSRILKQSIASIIYDEDAFGKGLAESFERASAEFGLTVNYKWSFDTRESDLEKRLIEIVDELSVTRNCGVIFLAVHSGEAAALIKRMKELGLDPPMIGSDSLAKQSFPHKFKDFPMEKLNPGFCTNDIYVAAYYISDTASLAGKRIRDEYVAKFKENPSAAAMTTYDAVSLGMNAIERTGVKGDNPSEDREKIRNFLSGVNGIGNAFKGVSGYIYFNREGDAQKTVPIALFKNNRMISAPVQLNPVKDFKEIGKSKTGRTVEGSIDKRLKPSDEILFVNGMYMQKTNYVYTGIEINEITSLELNKLLFDMDFYLWFRFQEGVEPWRIEFLNSAEPVKLEKPVSEEKTGNIVYRKYHVKGRFKADFLSRSPPFGHHILGVNFRHIDLTRDRLVYIIDELGMGTTRAGPLKKGSARFLSSVSGWTVSQLNFFQDTLEKNSMGDPRWLSALHGKVNYSRFNLAIEVKKIQIAFRGIIKNGPINYVLLLMSVVMILLTGLLGKMKEYVQWAKLVLIFQIFFTALLFLSSEVLLLDVLMGKTGNHTLEMIKLGFDILWWLAPAYFLSKAVRQFIVSPLEKSTDRTVPSLLILFVTFIIYILAFFGIVAFVFDQRLTSLLATSGVLAMIIGLAIQINISNIFSGIAINLERPFRVGDWVKIGADTGKVVDITWRTTRITSSEGNIVSIPNSNASEAVVVNYDYPDGMCGHDLTVYVDMAQEPDKIKKLLLDAVNSTEGVFTPSVIFKGFSKRISEYWIFFKIKDFSQRNILLEAVWKNVLGKMNSEGVKPAAKN